MIIDFPGTKKSSLACKDVEVIGFLTADDRDLYIKDKEMIAKIMAFIVREKIKIVDGDL